jgi:hypothetical protein
MAMDCGVPVRNRPRSDTASPTAPRAAALASAMRDGVTHRIAVAADRQRIVMLLFPSELARIA